jgi:hypothetical protein
VARHLVHADHRPIRVAGALVDGERILHLRHKPSALFGRNHPSMLQMRLQFVFLSV